MTIASDLLLVLAGPAGGWEHWGYGGGWSWLWPAGMLFWVAVLALLVWLVARRIRPGAPTGAERAKDLLAEQFARGQISEEEYEERLSVLTRRRS